MSQSTLSYAGLLAWALKHAKDLPGLLSLGQAVLEATGVRDRWSAFKSFGDYVVTIADDFPLHTAFAVGAEAQLLAQFEAQKLGDGTLLRKILPLIELLLPLLLDRVIPSLNSHPQSPSPTLGIGLSGPPVDPPASEANPPGNA